jgi:hypothetical protein
MRLRNPVHLQESAALRRVATRLLATLAPQQRVVSERILAPKDVAALSLEGGWIAAGSSPAWGIAALCRGMGSLETALAASRAALQLASSVRSELGTGPYGEGRLVLTPHAPLPEWSCIEVATSSGSIVCAGTFPCLSSIPIQDASTRAVKVRMFLQASCSEVHSGSRVSLGPTVVGEVPELGIMGIVRGGDCTDENNESREGVFMNVVDEVEVKSSEVRPIPLRIDLGSLELSVEEVAALRPGAQLEIAGGFPAECFLRIGATALARGVLEVGVDGFTLCVEEVF